MLQLDEGKYVVRTERPRVCQNAGSGGNGFVTGSYVIDVVDPIDEGNPARQVILNNHSPDVVAQLKRDEILLVDAIDGPEGRAAQISSVEGGWRRDVPRATGPSPLSPRRPLAFSR